MLGSSAARIIGFVSIPILTRIYSPEDYGALALFVASVAVLVPFATLKYSTAIPLPKTDAMAVNLLALSLLLIFALVIIIAIPLLLFGETILAWFNAQELAQWWWMIVLGVAGSAIYELFSLWSTRKKQYKTIAKTQIIQSLMGNLVKIVLGVLGLKPFGLIFGQLITQSAGISSLIKDSINDFKVNIPTISFRRIKFVAIFYREFAYYRLPSQFFMALSTQAPVVMMATLFDRELTGQLSLAVMAISLPAGLIGSSMAKAFYAEVAFLGRHNIEKIKTITIDIQKKLFIVGIPCAGLLMLFAESAFIFIFGEKWATAGYFAAVLAPFILMQLTSAPLVQLLNILGSQFDYLKINITRLIGLIFIFMVFRSFNFESHSLVKVLSAYLSIFYLSISLFIFYSVNKSLKVGNVEKNP